MLARSLFALLVLGSWAAGPALAADRERLAIVGADVLTMTGTGKLRDQIVLIEGDRIVRMGPAKRTKVPAGHRRVDARGMTLMPGLVDMHIHLAPAPGKPGDAAQRALAVMLAHGVTTARTMAGAPAHLGVREAIEAGRITGPRLYATAPAINLGNTKSTEEARAAVANASGARFDLIKSHHIDDPVVWQAVQDEAARRRIPTAGHVANTIGLPRALAARQQVEHLDGFFLELLPKDAPERAIPFAQVPPPPVIEAVATASDAHLEALARKVAASGGYMVPTLSLFELIADQARTAAELRAQPEMRFIPAPALDQWAAQREQMAGMGYTPELGAKFRETRRKLVRALHRAGVPIMAGSDTAQAFHIWGPGLIKEVEALGAAGLAPVEALKAATVAPRNYFRSLPNGGSALGWRADFGTVEEGARADLILLRHDPSKDLGALRTLRAVIAGGKLHDRAALDAMLERAAADAKAVPPPAQK
jgi:imidazolonepropionase-like amidohydrolase